MAHTYQKHHYDLNLYKLYNYMEIQVFGLENLKHIHQ